MKLLEEAILVTLLVLVCASVGALAGKCTFPHLWCVSSGEQLESSFEGVLMPQLQGGRRSKVTFEVPLSTITGVVQPQSQPARQKLRGWIDRGWGGRGLLAKR